MENIKKIRLENLKTLVKEFRSKTEMAEELDMKSSYISQLLSGYRAIGEKTARKIENKSGRRT